MEAFGLLSDEDRAQAIVILNRRLSATDLRAALDHLDSGGTKSVSKKRKTVESIIVEAERQPARGRPRTRLADEELARFLVDRRGSALLESSELRRLLALRATDDQLDRLHSYEGGTKSRKGRPSQAQAIASRKWHPGKSWPRYFVRELDLPKAFAGVPGAPREPHSLEVAPFIPLPSLEDFQRDLKSQATEILNEKPGANRAVLTMPTGAGKTRTAVESLVAWKLSQDDSPAILWIAQSDELCEQAVQAFKEVWTDLGQRPERVRSNLEIARFWGSAPVPEDPDIVVASIQKLQAAVAAEDSTKRAELAQLGEEIGAVVVDEAHRINAASYTEVLGFLGIDLSQSSRTPLLGLTATPFRSDDRESKQLRQKFHNRLLRSESLGDDPIGTLRRRKVLSEVKHELLQYGAPVFDMEKTPSFVKYFDQFNDFHPDFLQGIGASESRNKALLNRLLEIDENCPTLFFGCSVEHAEAMSILLRREGRAADVVTGKTRSATRRALIEQFRDVRLSVLCNYGVLTTGFDAPKVGALVVGRPTTSRVLYEQMIGRGMRGRLFGGTDECTVIDVRDNIRFHGELIYNRYDRYWGKV